jgi:hypothetical protein
MIYRRIFDNQPPSVQKVGLSEVVVDSVEMVGLYALWVQQDLIRPALRGPALRMRPADYESACSTICRSKSIEDKTHNR